METVSLAVDKHAFITTPSRFGYICGRVQKINIRAEIESTLIEVGIRF